MQKIQAHSDASLIFNQSEVFKKDEHIHLGMILDSKLNFNSNVREVIIKARRGVGIIRYLSKYVSRDVLEQIYKLYVRPHLDYGDIIYHKYDPEYTLELTKKLESTQYSAALAVSGSWRGTNTDKTVGRTKLGISFPQKMVQETMHAIFINSEIHSLRAIYFNIFHLYVWYIITYEILMF